jgi:hypothetical protein
VTTVTNRTTTAPTVLAGSRQHGERGSPSPLPLVAARRAARDYRIVWPFLAPGATVGKAIEPPVIGVRSPRGTSPRPPEEQSSDLTWRAINSHSGID